MNYIIQGTKNYNKSVLIHGFEQAKRVSFKGSNAMISNIYTVYDKVGCQSGPVFESRNDGVAVRQFRSMDFNGFNDDFKLLRLGSIDHDNNVITVEPVPVDVIGDTIVNHEEVIV